MSHGHQTDDRDTARILRIQHFTGTRVRRGGRSRREQDQLLRGPGHCDVPIDGPLNAGFRTLPGQSAPPGRIRDLCTIPASISEFADRAAESSRSSRSHRPFPGHVRSTNRREADPIPSRFRTGPGARDEWRWGRSRPGDQILHDPIHQLGSGRDGLLLTLPAPARLRIAQPMTGRVQ